eukprot:jgi/Ulvmu1/4422/UM002_0147.1
MASGTLAQGVVRKVKRITTLDLSSDNLRDSLMALSTVEVQPGNGRTALKSSMESALLNCSRTFSSDWEHFVEGLGKSEEHVLTMLQICTAAKALVSDRNSTPAVLLHRTESLLQELGVTSSKAAVVSRFVRDYQLDSADAETISTGDVDEKFFSALERVHRVHENCRSLLHTHHQRAGLELLDSMASYEETAYERLCKWVQSQCQSLTDVDIAEVHPLLSSALNALKARPVLLRYCCEEVATARHSAVFNAFLVALTQGAPRPIEMHAHNPRRYVGDMLAWVHQAIASEKELLTSLLVAPEAIATDTDTVDVVGISLYDLLDKIMEGVCQPLRLRVEQVLLGSPPVLMNFQLYQLLAFYLAIIQQIMPSKAALLDIIAAMRDLAHRGFQQQVSNWTDKLHRTPLPVPDDLTCPSQVQDVFKQVLQVVDAFESDMNEGEVQEDPAASLGTFLDSSVQPLISACEHSAAASQTGPDAEARERKQPHALNMFLLNCMLSMWSPLSLHRSCAQHVAQLRTRIDAQVESLAKAEGTRLLVACSIPADPERHCADMSVQQLRSLLSDMFVQLSAVDAIPDYEAIAVPRFRVALSQGVCRFLVKSYQTLHCTYTARGGDAGEVKGPEQIATLLGA